VHSLRQHVVSQVHYLRGLVLGYFLSLTPASGSGRGAADVTAAVAEGLAAASAIGAFASGRRFLVRAALASRYA
jgi:hypothetical protein